jgi:hypothetical protein
MADDPIGSDEPAVSVKPAVSDEPAASDKQAMSDKPAENEANQFSEEQLMEANSSFAKTTSSDYAQINSSLSQETPSATSLKRKRRLFQGEREDFELSYNQEKKPRGRRQVGDGLSLTELHKKLEGFDKPELLVLVDYMHKLLADHQKAIATNFSRYFKHL